MSTAVNLARALTRKNIIAMAALTNPPPAVVLVCATVLILLSPGETVPADLSWAAVRREIAQAEAFQRVLAAFDGKNIPKFKIRALQPFLTNPSFNPLQLQGVCVQQSSLWLDAVHCGRHRTL